MNGTGSDILTNVVVCWLVEEDAWWFAGVEGAIIGWDEKMWSSLAAPRSAPEETSRQSRCTKNRWHVLRKSLAWPHSLNSHN